jgi:hypothetical protein
LGELLEANLKNKWISKLSQLPSPRAQKNQSQAGPPKKKLRWKLA